MKTETEPTVHPLSPRFASLEKSLSEYNGHSNESPRYDGESNASPRILTKAGNYVLNQAEGRNELEIPIFNLSPLSTLPFLRELAGNRNMSLSLEKTLDSESLSITTKPLWDELVEAGYGHDFQYETTDGADHSSAGIVERKSDMLNKEDNNDSGSIKSPANRRKQLGASNSRQQRAPTKDAGGTANNIKNVVLGESLNSVVLKSQRSDHEREISATKVKDLNNLTLPDTAVIEPKQTPVSSNMERKLLSTLPKKLREEAVLRTFAANLKQASSTSRSAAPKKLSLEGRQSADSGRESVLEDEAYPRLYRFDSSSSVSSVGSTRSAVRGGANSGIKPWSVVMMAETIKKRRQEAASKGKRAKMELDTLKEKFEQSQAKANGLEAELGPLREKLRRYEVIIENLEDRMEGSKQEMLVKDRDSLAKIDKLERDRSKALQEEQMAREEIESELKSKLRQLESEVNFYKKQADELEDRLAILKENENKDEENNPFAKQMASLRVRPVFDDCNTQAGPSFSRRC